MTTAAFGAAMALTSLGAAAAPSRTVAVHLAECPTALSVEILRILAVELEAPVVETPLDRAHLRVFCTTPTDIDLVLATEGESEVRRRMSLENHDGRVHGRIVALALAELTEVAPPREESEPARQTEPPARRTPAPPTETGRTALQSPRHLTVRLTASAVGMVWTHDGAWSTGAELLSTVPLGGSWGLRGGVGFTGGRDEVALGTIVVRSVAVPMGLHWENPGRFPWGATAGMRGGWVKLAGEAADPATTKDGAVAGFWAGPFASLGAAFPKDTDWGAAARVELGYAAWSIRGLVEGDPSPWRGPWLLFALGVEWRR